MRSLLTIAVRRFVASPVAPVLWAARPHGRGEATGGRSEVGPRRSGGDVPDPDDMHALMVEHSDAVFRLAFSVVRDRALAEDVTQETMLKAWLALPTFRGESSLRGWVMRIAHNTAISTLRSRKALVSDGQQRHRVEGRRVALVDATGAGDCFCGNLLARVAMGDDLFAATRYANQAAALSVQGFGAVAPLPTQMMRPLSPALTDRLMLASASLSSWVIERPLMSSSVCELA